MLNRIVVVSFLLTLLIAACDDGVGPSPYRIALTSDSTDMTPGDTLRLSATVMAQDTEVTGAAVTWSSGDTTTVVVASDGLVTARALGIATIRAGFKGAWSSVKVVVRGGPGCDPTGVRHSGTITDANWRAADSPHFITGSLIAGHDLTIEAGVIVCAAPDATITMLGGSKLHAAGTAERRVRFLAADTARGWHGIRAIGNDDGSTMQLDYTDVEFADYLSNYIVADHSHFRHTDLYSSSYFTLVNIQHSIIEDAHIQITAGTFRDNIVRRGLLEAVRNTPGWGLTIDGGRIEDSPGTALLIGSRNMISEPKLTMTNPPVIVNSHGPIVDMPGKMFFQAWPTSAAQAALLNNENLTIALWTLDYGDIELRGGLNWELSGAIMNFRASSLTIDPGATVKIIGGLTVYGPLRAVGTAEAPVRITGPPGCSQAVYHASINVAGSATSVLSYVTVMDTYLQSSDQNVLRIDNASSNCFTLLKSKHSRILDSSIHDVPSLEYPPVAALGIAGDSILVARVSVRRSTRSGIVVSANDVTVTSCDIADNAGDGVIVSAGTNLHVHDCNIERNAGFGINNTSSTHVNATGNWWGDPAGPLGPAGDGVAGDVDYSLWYTTPRTALPRPSPRIIQ